MAKTWKTHPWSVRMASAPGILALELHDHGNGICDLPQPGVPRGRWWSNDGRCRWEPSALLECGRHGKHSCRNCARANRVWHRIEIGHERSRVRAAMRLLVKGLPPEEVDAYL
jgi:hypothetical protein